MTVRLYAFDLLHLRLFPYIQDQDKDGRLGYEDYKKSVEQDDLLLESFGQCLPDDKVAIHV